VIVMEHPEAFLRTIIWSIEFTRTCSKDVQVGVFRSLQPPDEEIPIPTQSYNI